MNEGLVICFFQSVNGVVEVAAISSFINLLSSLRLSQFQFPLLLVNQDYIGLKRLF